jgi:hypothetical protein
MLSKCNAIRFSDTWRPSSITNLYYIRAGLIGCLEDVVNWLCSKDTSVDGLFEAFGNPDHGVSRAKITNMRTGEADHDCGEFPHGEKG